MTDQKVSFLIACKFLSVKFINVIFCKHRYLTYIILKLRLRDAQNARLCLFGPKTVPMVVIVFFAQGAGGGEIGKRE